MSPVLSSEKSSKIEYNSACIRMRLLNFLMVLRVQEELMVVRLLMLLMSGFWMRFLHLMRFLTVLRAVLICSDG